MKIEQIWEATAQGNREEMQDVVLSKHVDGTTALCAVFDGHGDYGADIASFAANSIERSLPSIIDQPTALECVRIARSALRSAAKQLQTSYIARTSGTTATVAVIKDEAIGVAYLGDSEVGVFDAAKDTFHSLVDPHDTYNQNERTRVIEAGGFISNTGYFNNALQISRAIGDTADSFVSSEAEIVEFDLNKPSFLVVASDGFWKSFRSQTYQEIKSCEQTILETMTSEHAIHSRDNCSLVVAKIT